jgi:hypothetical protein
LDTSFPVEKFAICFVAFIAPGGLVDHRKYLAQIGAKGGKLGGTSTSKAKRAAAVQNAAKARAARSKKAYPPCPSYHAHTWNAEGRCYGAECREKYPDLRRRKPKVEK